MVGSLDIRTLIVVAAMVRGVQALALVLFWRVHSTDRAARDWAIGSVLCAVGTSVASVRDFFPLWISVIVGNGLLLAGWMTFDFGIGKVAGVDPPRRFGIAVWVATLVTMSWFYVLEPNFVVRVVAFSLGVAIFDVYAAGACLRAAAGQQKALLTMVALCLLVLALSNLYRAFGAYDGHLTTLMMPGPGQAQLPLVAIGFSVTVTVLLVLLTSQRLQDLLDLQARIDPLTKAFNRRALEEMADREWARTCRHGYSLAILMVDIDHFKRINDTYGHVAGDTALAAVSAIAQPVLRPADIWCRYGGEEFVVVLPQSTGEHAMVIAERLRAAIESQGSASNAEGFVITVSIGVAEATDSRGSWRDTLSAADRAMYQAKMEGRNRVVLASRHPEADPSPVQAFSAIGSHRRSPA